VLSADYLELTTGLMIPYRARFGLLSAESSVAVSAAFQKFASSPRDEGRPIGGREARATLFKHAAVLRGRQAARLSIESQASRLSFYMVAPWLARRSLLLPGPQILRPRERFI
jgi:hypothetical protein